MTRIELAAARSEVWDSGAKFSNNRQYRYELRRIWGHKDTTNFVNFIGVNPSTADEREDDPTIRRCICFAQDWGFDGLIMTNCFAYCSTDFKKIKFIDDPVGLDNDEFLVGVACRAKLIVAAWGKNGAHYNRDVDVKRVLKDYPLHYLRMSEKTGQPWHPLYLPKDLKPILWER